MQQVTIEIRRGERDVLRDWIDHDLSGLSDINLYLTNGDVSSAQQRAEHYRIVFELLDQLGWDNAKSRVSLQMERSKLEAITRRYLKEVDEMIASDVRDLSAAMNGDDPHSSTAEEWSAQSQQALAQDLVMRSICESILRQLEETSR